MLIGVVYYSFKSSKNKINYLVYVKMGFLKYG